MTGFFVKFDYKQRFAEAMMLVSVISHASGRINLCFGLIRLLGLDNIQPLSSWLCKSDNNSNYRFRVLARPIIRTCFSNRGKWERKCQCNLINVKCNHDFNLDVNTYGSLVAGDVDTPRFLVDNVLEWRKDQFVAVFGLLSGGMIPRDFHCWPVLAEWITSDSEILGT